jgi:hypothetical protein
MRSTLRMMTILAVIVTLSASVSTGQSYTIGADNGANTTTSYPTPFGDWYKTQRMQFLYLASELSAAGMGAGDITEISWNVLTATGTQLTEGYTVKMLNTATASLGLTTWEAGATTVWGPTNYTPFVGTNSFVLSTPFYWDGVSNLLIEICGGSNLGTYISNATVTWTGPLAFNGSRTYRSDTELSPCTYTGTTYSDYTPGGPDYRPRVTLTAAAGAECAGTPVVDDAVSTMGSVCPSDAFTVSISAIAEGGITYQWQSSTDGGATWGDIGGATAASYMTTQSVGTWYQCVVTCTNTGDEATSGAVYVGMNAVADCYCDATYTTGTGSGDYISNVTLGTINNTTDGAAAPYHTYYEGMSTDLTTGSEYTVSITVGSYASNNDVAAWIDWNADGDFDDVGEKLGEVQDLAAWATGSIIFTVPVDATLGMTRLRTRESWATTGILPCNTYGYGETEDYDINIISAVPTCDQATGLYSDNVTATTTDLHWDAVDGATDYLLTVADMVSRSVWMQVDATTNMYSLAGLTPGWDYGFKVRAYCLDDGLVAPVSEKHFWSTPIREGDELTSVNMYPNPNDGLFELAINGFDGNQFELQVYNSVGQVVYSQVIEISSDNHLFTVDLGNAAAGIYQVKLTNDMHDLNYSIVVNE